MIFPIADFVARRELASKDPPVINSTSDLTRGLCRPSTHSCSIYRKHLSRSVQLFAEQTISVWTCPASGDVASSWTFINMGVAGVWRWRSRGIAIPTGWQAETPHARDSWGANEKSRPGHRPRRRYGIQFVGATRFNGGQCNLGVTNVKPGLHKSSARLSQTLLQGAA